MTDSSLSLHVQCVCVCVCDTHTHTHIETTWERNISNISVNHYLVMTFMFKLFCNEVICISLCSKTEDDFTAEIPAVRFVDNGTNLQCTLMLCNSHSYETSELLSKYASINEDVQVLGVVFRLWAQVSTSVVHVV